MVFWIVVLTFLILLMLFLTILGGDYFWFALFIVYPFYCLCVGFFKREFHHVWNARN